MAWTEQQIQTLKKMWGNGYSASDIARSLGGGVTRNAVIGKAHRLKLSAGGVATRRVPEAPSKTAGVVMTTITKISKKRAKGQITPIQTKARSEKLAKLLARDPIKGPAQAAKRSEGIPVTRAGERHCRWPIGDPRSPDFRFCGCETHEELPYCLHHARIAYQTLGRKTRANANLEKAVPKGELTQAQAPVESKEQ